jgi:hypothetical protein
MTFDEKLFEKGKMKKRRKANAQHKANERLRTANYQRTIDSFKKSMKRKGCGRAVKEKGKTMPTLIASNTRCPKSWKHLNGEPMRGESMKVAIIFSIT